MNCKANISFVRNRSDLWSLRSDVFLFLLLVCRVKELTVDPNQVMEGGRPNIHAVNQLDLLDEEWLSISPQRDDLKLLCEQNVSALKHKSDCLHLELISENRAAVEQEVKQGCILLSSSVPDSYKVQSVQDTGI